MPQHLTACEERTVGSLLPPDAEPARTRSAASQGVSEQARDLGVCEVGAHALTPTPPVPLHVK